MRKERKVYMKKLISIIICIIVLMIFILINHNMTKNAINTCIESGNNPAFCERTLR